MSTTGEILASTGLEDLRGMLAGLGESSEAVDSRIRQQVALLAFARRTNAQPALMVLVQDAIAMVAEVLRAHLYGVAEVKGSSLALDLTAVDRQGKAVDMVSHQSRLDPAISLAAYAVYSGCPVTTADLVSEERFTDLFLRKVGVVSALAVPLHLAGKSFGAFCVCTRTPRRFSLDELRFVETIGHLLAGAIARQKLEDDLRAARAWASVVAEMTSMPVLTLDAEGKILDMNAVCEQLSGLNLAEVRDKPLWAALVASEDVEAVQNVFRSAARGDLPAGFEATLACPQGRGQRITWSWRVLFDDRGQAERVILAGLPPSPSPGTGAQLRELQQYAAKASDAIAQLRTRVDDLVSTGSRAGTVAPLGLSHAAGADAVDEALRGLQPTDEKHPRELRRSPRLSFQYIQRIAPMFGNQLPPRKKFFDVECKDISAGGIAFFLDRAPDFDTLVVALGRPPGERFFSARVVRVAKTDHQGRTRYLVGCRFTGRVAI